MHLLQNSGKTLFVAVCDDDFDVGHDVAAEEGHLFVVDAAAAAAGSQPNFARRSTQNNMGHSVYLLRIWIAVGCEAGLQAGTWIRNSRNCCSGLKKG